MSHMQNTLMVYYVLCKQAYSHTRFENICLHYAVCKILGKFFWILCQAPTCKSPPHHTHVALHPNGPGPIGVQSDMEVVQSVLPHGWGLPQLVWYCLWWQPDDINNPSSLPSGSGKSECHHLNQGWHADHQSFPEQLKKMKLTAQNIDGWFNKMLSLVQDPCDKLEKEKQDRERDVKSLSMQLDKERADRK